MLLLSHISLALFWISFIYCVFKALGEHRNQIVHFAHTNYQDIDATKVSVVVEQWSAWHYLHELIVTTWPPIFDS
ncbi:hypothetical protein [Photobacterium phosphoreum]|uniref:hypothetical protein n=1 Tax=Photobacterium phosphoreum TaxID=659 RepID=UPI000D157C09|nr:hypothetical protein [Photobacterium phosphoreum]PTB33469.1 hypothetical protein DAT36_06335 [Photobacterium phosphoreum]